MGQAFMGPQFMKSNHSSEMFLKGSRNSLRQQRSLKEKEG
jgi:hypothetical protein